MLCQLLLYREMNQSYIYIYPLFFQFSSCLDHHRTFSSVPYSIQQILVSYLFYTQQCIYVCPNLPIHLTPLSPFGNHKFVLYICDSISALQINSSLPFFQIPHISSFTHYFSLLDLLYSVWQSLGLFISLKLYYVVSFYG